MISIIVPVYQVERFLPQCIQSIINQTYRDFEIILVDDGSPDNCGKICDEYLEKDKRIRVFHKKNGGLSDARNFGLSKATGKYIGFVDSDDWIEPYMYEVLIKLAEANEADIVSCGYYDEFNEQKSIYSLNDKKYDSPIKAVKALIFNEINVMVWSKIYRKSCFTNIVFPNGYAYEDIFTQHKLFMQANLTLNVSKPLYHHRERRNKSISQTHSLKNLLDCWQSHKSRYDFFLNDCRFNTDNEFINKLRYYCAYAIGRTWAWYFGCTEQEKERYAFELQEMYGFCIKHFSLDTMKSYPISVIIPVFLGKYNNIFIFALLFYMLQGYRWIKRYVFVPKSG